MTSLLSLHNVVAGYDERDVLRGVSFDIPQGRFVAVIGPNGHGKTTLMRAICGVTPLRQGRILLDGRDISKLDAASRRAAGVAMAPQGDMLFPQMSVQENLLLGAHIEADKTDVAARIDEVYSIFPALSKRQKQLAYTLSGGERRMLAIGRAMSGRSRLLIVDEPSLGLSPRIVDEVYAALRSLKAKGAAVLLVEENVSRARDFSEDLYLVDQGAIVWSGAASDVDSASDILTTYLGA